MRQDELQSLIVLSDAMLSDPAGVSKGELDYTPIGVSGEARKLFTERRYAEAASVLRDAVAVVRYRHLLSRFMDVPLRRHKMMKRFDGGSREQMKQRDSMQSTGRPLVLIWQVSESSRQLLEHSWNLWTAIPRTSS